MRSTFNNKSVLITGATGFFGIHCLKKILLYSKPKRVDIYSRDELKQTEMSKSLKKKHFQKTRFFIGDVRDLERLSIALRDVDFVIHAAALKQVPAAEYNPIECIRTNIIGAQNIILASLRNNVKKVISLSTDKAVNPINLYGSSKLSSE